MRIDLTLAQINGIKLLLGDDADDERLLADMIEGETDAYAMIGKLLDAVEREEGDRAALTEQMEARKVRRDRCDRRIAAAREGIMAIMDCAGLDKITLPEATISARVTPAKLAVNDPAAVPEQYYVLTPKPSMDKIKADFSVNTPNLPNWLRVEDARPGITVRRA